MYKILFLNDDAKDGTIPTFLCFFVRNSRLLWSLCANVMEYFLKEQKMS